MRYLDLLLNSPECPLDLKQRLRASVPVIADNVTRYFMEGTSQDYWELAKDFPNLAPPFGSFWIETVPTNRINSEINGMMEFKMQKYISWWGALVEVRETKDFENLTAPEFQARFTNYKASNLVPVVEGIFRAKGWYPGMSEEDSRPIYASLTPEELEYISSFKYRLDLEEGTKRVTESELLETKKWFRDAKWYYNVVLFIYGAGSRKPYNPVMVVTIFVKPDGSVFPISPDGTPCAQGLCGEQAIKASFEEQRELSGFYRTLLDPFWLTISFLHCNNVETRDLAVSAKEERFWKGKTGNSLIRFKTLMIDHLKNQLDSSSAGSDGLKKALHICRGHFSHYSEGRPLFGKYPGTFWVPQHVRGSAEHGVIEKRYVVK